MARRSEKDPTTKPVVFLSHSSKDAAILQRLRKALIEKTSGTVTFFLSSDGQSVPLGRNWVHSIEDALTSTALMLVCVSGSALQSQWIFFEAGFAYSKKVQVVPIGLPGVDLSQLAPPLSLLQGFNVTSHEGLNNIITILNRTFSCSYPEAFAESDFRLIFGGVGGNESSVLGPYGDAINRIVFDFLGVDENLDIRQIPSMTGMSSVSWQRDKKVLRTFGMALARGNVGQETLRVSVVPAISRFAIGLLDNLANQLTWDRTYGYQFGLQLASHVKFEEDADRVSAALMGTAVAFYSVGDLTGYELGKFRFRFERREASSKAESDSTSDSGLDSIFPAARSLWVMIAYTGDLLTDVNLLPLLGTLFETRVLYVSEGRKGSGFIG